MKEPTPVHRLFSAALLAVLMAAAGHAQPLTGEQSELIIRPELRPGLSETLVRPDALRIATLPDRLNHLKVKPNYELLFQANPELRSTLQRYPGLANVKPAENAEVIERFPGVTAEMLEALQHFNRTGLPPTLTIDPGLLDPRFGRVLPRHDRFLENALNAPTLNLDQTLGNQMLFQTVSPELAIAMAMQAPEAADWLARVRAASGYELDALATCRNAIWALFETACGGDPLCEFESAYEARCLNAANDARAATCVEAVDTYYDLCFGGACPILDADWPAVMIGRPDDVACSGALIQAGPGETVMATVDHCEPYVGEGALNRIGQGDLVSEPVPATATASLGFTQQMRGYYIPADRVGDGAASAAPEEFAVTVLLAYNRVLDLRNQVAERFGIGPGPIQPLSCDASVLCTVTEVRPDGELDHTCQSTRGGSGGALVQFNDGVPHVVGLNMGARSAGMVAFNLGAALQD